MDVPSVFASVITKKEWLAIPSEIAQKVGDFASKQIEELTTSKALLETKQFQSEETLNNNKSCIEKLENECELLKSKLKVATEVITEHENQLSQLTAELNKLHSQCNTFEAETAEYRQQRNSAVSERDEHVTMLQKKNTEVEHLQMDVNNLNKQLEIAMNEKYDALSQADEIASMKMTLEDNEKKIEQERKLFNNQIESLTDELNKKTEEILNMRCDNTSHNVQLDVKLIEKNQELTIAAEEIKSLTELNRNLLIKNGELNHEVQSLHNSLLKMEGTYVCELAAQTKMSKTYKDMFEGSQQLASELKVAVSDVQQSLQSATERYGELETKHKESELAHEEIISKKNQCIDMLKKELETANELIEGNSSGVSLKSISTSKLIKPGLSFSELYSKFITASEQFINKEEECSRLNNYITFLNREIEEKGPLIKKLREEYSNALDANDELKAINDRMQNDMDHLKELNAECKRSEGIVVQENEKMKKEISDLSRQVVHLLQEIEHLQVGSSISTDICDIVVSADITTKKLVTFNNISELQSTNQKLLALVREFKERQEDEDFMDPPAIANLKKKLNDLRENEREMLEERDKQTKMMSTVQNQRDLYKNLYAQAIKSQNVSMQLEETVSQNGDDKVQTETECQSDVQIKSLENQLEKHNKLIEQMKEENDTYRKEKSANEKILLEQLDSMRGEVRELTRLNCKLNSHTESNEEKLKVMQSNIEIYKKQINALEKRNKIYSDAIVKHEEAATYLKDETITCQTKLAKAEVMVANLQKVNILLKDAKQRFMKELETLKGDSHQQHLIKSNIQLLKASFKRSDAENKLKLEVRVDEMTKECLSLRRRLQNEQDHFKKLTEHLEKQANYAQKRMEDEKTHAHKLRKEVAEMREELIQKSSHLEELSKKLKMGLFAIPDTNVDTKKFRETEQNLSDAKAEINSLKVKLNIVQNNSDNYLKAYQSSGKKVEELVENNESLVKEIEKWKGNVKELQKQCTELEGKLSIQLDDRDISNANIQTKSSQLQEELNIKNMDLQTAKRQLESCRSENKSLLDQLKTVENKYAREVTLHSADLQMLSNTKEELEKMLDQLKNVEIEKQQAIKLADQCKRDLEKQTEHSKKEKEDIESQFKDMEAQNSLLLDQIQAFNTQLSILQTEQHNQSAEGDSSLNTSLNEDDVRSPEQLLKIIKYLRQQKDIVVSKADILQAENTRLKSKFDTLYKQFEDANRAWESEQNMEISVVSAATHDELLTKLETFNALTDSNRSLRQERDTLLTQVTELRDKAEKYEVEVVPLQEKNKDLMTKADQMQSENVSLRAECTRWRQRANLLIEKTNRTNPDDWKKLQTERETLAKQLTTERGNTTKLNDEINNLKQDKTKSDDVIKSLKQQINNQTEELTRVRDEINNLQTQITQLNNTVDQQSTEILRLKEENRLLTEDTAGKDVTITELKNNLAQVRKIAKKYKIQCEDQTKEIEVFKQDKAQNENKEIAKAERQEQVLTEQRSQLEKQLTQLENQHKEAVDSLTQQISNCREQIESHKKEIENLKQAGTEKEERFKTLFKNAKDRIVSLTEQNNNLKEELNKQSTTSSLDTGDQTAENNHRIAELLEKIAALEREREEALEERQQEREKFSADTESLNQKISQLQRQLGLQQGAKPSTSTTSSEKSSSERPTADIKPMAGHSTNTQTQSIPIQPWRSGGEPPLASIKPMSAQLRTVAVLPTSQSPSAVMIPPQQQVHTTGSNNVEVLSSSPTSSHSDYVPSTSSAGSMLGDQVIVPPTQSSEDTEDDENNRVMQTVTQTQAVALILPRVEPPGGSPTQEQGTSSSSNTVTTTQAGHKREREADNDDPSTEETKTQQPNKRTRLQTGDSDLEVEYQVPTSSQRDQDDDNIILVESDEDGGPDEGEGAEDDQEDPDTEGYDVEGMEHDNYEDPDCQEVEDEGAGNEVEVMGSSIEMPNQSESCIQEAPEESLEQPQSEAISSGTDGTVESVSTMPAQSSPQEGVPSGGEQTSELTSQADDENLPESAISETPNDSAEGSSGECIQPADVAGTSTEGTDKIQQKEDREGDDRVSSEGEKPPPTEENEEEGREAEASPSTNSRRVHRGSNSARRTLRIIPRGMGSMRMNPAPIMWERSMHQQRHQDRSRGHMSPNFQSRGVVRRPRGRNQRHFGRY